MVKRAFDWMGVPTSDDATGGTTPAINHMAQNFPNPFNPSTTIKFGLKARGPVSVKVYNVAGGLVRTLVDDVRDAGSHSIVWDATNNRGMAVASGIYLLEMKTVGFSKSRKMVILR
jgi:flagellar hook assembly protein FlgD